MRVVYGYQRQGRSLGLEFSLQAARCPGRLKPELRTHGSMELVTSRWLSSIGGRLSMPRRSPVSGGRIVLFPPPLNCVVAAKVGGRPACRYKNEMTRSIPSVIPEL